MSPSEASAAVHPASTSVDEPWMTLFYARGMAFDGVLSALEANNIRCQPVALPFVPANQSNQPSVYLIDHSRVAGMGDRADVERVFEALHASCGAYIVVVGNAGDAAAAWLAEIPSVAGWVTRPVDATALVAAVRTAARLGAVERMATEALREKAEHQSESDQLLQIGLALSSERDIAKLKTLIVRKARELTSADGGSLFIVADVEGEKKLRFSVAQTGPKDEGVHIGAMLPLSRASISGFVASTGEIVRLGDAYHIPDDREFKLNKSFDQQNNYRTKSVLCVPMLNHKNEVIGAIQLINRKPRFDVVLEGPAMTEEIVTEFTPHHERICSSLASQAAVALENNELVDSIQQLFEQFVRASVKAIEARDKSTQGHSERVARLTVAQAEMANTIEAGPLADLHFNVEQIREMRYAALLHDFGKVAVPEYIFAKAKKLPDGRLNVIKLRFGLASEQVAAAAQRKKLELLMRGAKPDDPEITAIDEQAKIQYDELVDLMNKVVASNEPSVVAATVADMLDDLLARKFNLFGEEGTLLDPVEYEYLKIPRGSLDKNERDKMQEHVTQSYRFLAEIPWTKTPWQQVADYAYGHHEHLDGTGYPRGLKGDEIAPQVRMMTISDVYDALTAADRPYKPAMPVAKALDILNKEFAERGKVDALLLDMFIQKKVYETISPAPAA